MEKLLGALRDVLAAEKAEKTARDAYEGYEWGYHGTYLYERSQMAREAFEIALNETIDARVRAVLAQTVLNIPSSSSP